MVRLPATAEESSDSAPSPQTTCWGGGGEGEAQLGEDEGRRGMGQKMELTASRFMGHEDGEPQEGWQAV